MKILRWKSKCFTRCNRSDCFCHGIVIRSQYICSMSISIIQKPAGNVIVSELTDFVVGSDEDVTAELLLDGFDNIVFKGVYSPAFLPGHAVRGVAVDFSEIVRQHLATYFPSGDVTMQSKFYRHFVVVFRGTASGETKVADFCVANIEAGHGKTYSDTVYGRFFTEQPLEKVVMETTPEHLTFKHEAGGTELFIRLFPADGGKQDTLVAESDIPEWRTEFVGFERVKTLTGIASLDGYHNYYDVVMKNTKGTDLCVQRYRLTESCGGERSFLFVNRQGGVDTVIFTGENTLSLDVEHHVGIAGGRLTAIDDSDDRKRWRQNSGRMPWRSRDWMADFIMSKKGHWLHDKESGLFREIVITEAEFSANDRNNLFLFTFGYKEKGTVCVKVHESYQYAWSDAFCVKIEDSPLAYSFAWSEALCVKIPEERYSFAWSEALCVKVNSSPAAYTFTWGIYICATNRMGANTGKKRARFVTITPTGGTPQSHGIEAAFTDPQSGTSYPNISGKGKVNLSNMQDAAYTARLNAFANYVYSLHSGLQASCPNLTTNAELTDTAMCPIGKTNKQQYSN